MPFTKRDDLKEESLEKENILSLFICRAVGVRWACFVVTFGSGISIQPQGRLNRVASAEAVDKLSSGMRCAFQFINQILGDH